MKATIQHNILIHVRVVVPTESMQTALNVMSKKGWVVEALLPMHRGLFCKDSTRREIIASHYLATEARSGDAKDLVNELMTDLSAA